MRKKHKYLFDILILFLVFAESSSISAQVGINTTDLTNTTSTRDLVIEGGLRINELSVEDAYSQTYSIATSATSSKLVDVDKIVKRFPKSLVANERGDVDYIDLSDYNAFGYRKMIYKSISAVIKQGDQVPPDSTPIPDTELTIGDYVTFQMVYVNKLEKYVELRAKEASSKKSYIVGEVLHDKGFMIIQKEMNDKLQSLTSKGVLVRLSVDSKFGYKSINMSIFQEGSKDIYTVDVQYILMKDNLETIYSIIKY